MGNVNDIVRLVGLFQVGSGCARYPRKTTWTHPNEGAFIPFSFFSFPLRAEKDIGSSFKLDVKRKGFCFLPGSTKRLRAGWTK